METADWRRASPNANLDAVNGADESAFRLLADKHRRELLLHCYRMLGSFQDAEDVLQETLLAAWHGFEGFEGRATLRTWLYKIATNLCLNAQRTARRRPAKAYDVPGVDPPAPTRLGAVPWLEPFPDYVLVRDRPADIPSDPAVLYEESESISLGFVTALQVLPHRQLAVLVLCDVVGFEAREVAAMLDATVDSVNSALKRARANLRDRPPRVDYRAPFAARDAIAGKFARAWQSADVDAVVELLTDDVFLSMPPIANEYEGRDLARAFFASIFQAGRRFDLVPTRANGQPAFGVYLCTDDASRGVGLYVLDVRAEGISAMVRFEAHVLASFRLPPSIPAG